MVAKMNSCQFFSVLSFICINIITKISCDPVTIISAEPVFNSYGSEVAGVRCRGQNLTSLSIFPCSTSGECNHILFCLRNEDDAGCKKMSESEYPVGACLEKGQHSSSEPHDEAVEGKDTCLQFEIEDFNYRHRAAVVKCASANQEDDPGSGAAAVDVMEKKEVAKFEIFVQDAARKSGKWRSTNNAFLIWLNAEVTDMRIDRHQQQPTFFVGQEVNVDCRALRLYFNNELEVTGLFTNGTTFPIDHVVLDYETDEDSPFWYHTVYKVKILSNMIGFSCYAPWLDGASADGDESDETEENNGWFERTFYFDTQEASPPVFDFKEKRTTFLNCDEFQDLAVNFTGGPVDKPRCTFSPDFRHSENFSGASSADDAWVIYPDIHAYGSIGSLRLSLGDRGIGTYSCQIGSSLGNDSVHFFVESREIYGSADAINQLDMKSLGAPKTESGGTGGCGSDGSVMDPESGRCYPIGPEKGPCDPGLAFNMLSFQDEGKVNGKGNPELMGKCGCSRLKEGRCTHFAFWPNDGKCYKHSTQGPCPSGFLFIIERDGDKEKLLCRTAPTVYHDYVLEGELISCPEGTALDPLGDCVDKAQI